MNDEMRKTETQYAEQTSKAISNENISLTITIFNYPESNGISLQAEGAIIACTNNNYCKISARIDNGEVEEYHVSISGNYIFPSKSAALVGAIARSKKMFIEVDFLDGAPRQFKFDTSGLNFKPWLKPPFKIAGLKISHPVNTDLLSGFSVKESGDITCYKKQNDKLILSGASSKEVSICLFKGLFYLMIIDIDNKESYSKVIDILNK